MASPFVDLTQFTSAATHHFIEEIRDFCPSSTRCIISSISTLYFTFMCVGSKVILGTSTAGCMYMALLEGREGFGFSVRYMSFRVTAAADAGREGEKGI